MPELQTITFTGAHADAYKPTYNNDGTWTILSPDNPGTLTANKTTAKSLNFGVTIPVGKTALILPYGADVVPGCAGCSVIPGTWVGTGSDEGMVINLFNPTSSAPTPTANQPVAYMLLVDNSYKINYTP